MDDANEFLIVVGYDGSAHGDAALRWALQEAHLRGARVRVVHVWHPPFVEGYPYTGAAFDADELDANAHRTLADGLAAATAGAPPGVRVESVVVCGDPASTLLERSKDAGMVVVGSRGLGGFRGMLLGSVSQQVVHHATCPVVVVRLPHHEEEAIDDR